jgi:hypothetical protein
MVRLSFNVYELALAGHAAGIIQNLHWKMIGKPASPTGDFNVILIWMCYFYQGEALEISQADASRVAIRVVGSRSDARSHR